MPNPNGNNRSISSVHLLIREPLTVGGFAGSKEGTGFRDAADRAHDVIRALERSAMQKRQININERVEITAVATIEIDSNETGT